MFYRMFNPWIRLFCRSLNFPEGGGQQAEQKRKCSGVYSTLTSNSLFSVTQDRNSVLELFTFTSNVFYRINQGYRKPIEELYYRL